MKKILFTLSIAIGTSLFSQAQIKLKIVKNDSNYYIGSIISGESYKQDYTTEFLGDGIYKPNLSVGNFAVDAAMGTKVGLKSLQEYIATFRDKVSTGSVNFSFSGLYPVVQGEAQLDKILSTKHAAKQLLNQTDLFTKYKVYASTASVEWFSIDSDLPEDGLFLSESELEKISSKEPVAVTTAGYGRHATLIVASNQEEAQLTKAFKIIVGKDHSQYEFANSILQEAFMAIVTVGNSTVDTMGLNPQQIIEKFVDFMSRPIEDKELLSPIFFDAVYIDDIQSF